MSTIIRHDDLEALRKKRIRIPDYFQQGSWVAFPIGVQSQSGLGPSATQLLLWLPVPVAVAPSGSSKELHHSALTAIVGKSQQPGTRGVLTRALNALVSVDQLARVESGENGENGENGQSIISGVEYSAQPFENIFWKHGWVLGTEKGLLVSLLNN